MKRESAVKLLVLCEAVYTLVLLQSGCASVSPGELSQGQKWVVEMEAERKRLNDQGFPQYTDY